MLHEHAVARRRLAERALLGEGFARVHEGEGLKYRGLAETLYR